MFQQQVQAFAMLAYQSAIRPKITSLPQLSTTANGEDFGRENRQKRWLGWPWKRGHNEVLVVLGLLVRWLEKVTQTSSDPNGVW